MGEGDEKMSYAIFVKISEILIITTLLAWCVNLAWKLPDMILDWAEKYTEWRRTK